MENKNWFGLSSVFLKLKSHFVLMRNYYINHYLNKLWRLRPIITCHCIFETTGDVQEKKKKKVLEVS